MASRVSGDTIIDEVGNDVGENEDWEKYWWKDEYEQIMSAKRDLNK